MKKTLIALMALASTAFGAEYSPTTILTTITALDSTENWVIGHENAKKNVEPVIDTNNGTLSLSNADWSRGYAIYTLPEAITLRNPTDRFTVSYDFFISDNNSLLTCTLISDQLAITAGHGSYNDEGRSGLQIGTSSITDGVFYNTQGPNTGGVYVDPLKTTVGSLANAEFTITTSVFWYEQESQFIVNTTTKYNGMVAYVGYIGIGDGCTLEKLVFSLDGNSIQRVSNMSITSEKTVPEPTTATLSLLALAGLAARRRRK